MPRMEKTRVYPSAKMAYPLPMKSPFSSDWRKEMKFMGCGRITYYVLRMALVPFTQYVIRNTLLQIGELPGCTIRVHFDLGYVELGLVYFAGGGEGDGAERSVIFAREDL